jgi:hypothetical protein
MSAYDIWVDFNRVDDEGETGTLKKFATIRLIPGELVIAGDHDGNTCTAEITYVGEAVVWLKLDMNTFEPAP